MDGWACPDIDPLTLIDAAIDGDVEQSRTLVDDCVADASATEHDDLALARSAQLGRTEIVRHLLDAGADPQYTDKNGNSVLIWASRWLSTEGQTDPETAADKATVVQLLLDRGVDVSVAGEGGHTALTVAAFAGHTDIVRLLLDAGAAVDVRTDHGSTPLMQAAAAGRAEVVEILLKSGADPDAEDDRGLSALEIADRQNHVDVADILRSATSG